MSFHVGQRVVCVDDTGWNAVMRLTWSYPVVRSVYSVREVISDADGVTCLRLNEIKNGRGFNRELNIVDEPFFRGSRFRPVKETDISIFTAMLAPTPKQKVRA